MNGGKTMNKFRTILIILGCLLIANVVNAQIPGELTVTNPGFEDGDLTGWSLWPTSGTHQSVISDTAHDGTYALKVVGADVAVYQTMATPTAGKLYLVEGHAMNPSTDPVAMGQQLRLEITFFDGSWNTLLQVFSDSITSESETDVWQTLFVTGICPEGAVNMNVGFNWIGTGDEGTAGSAYGDDLRAFELRAEPTIWENLGFEETEVIWDPTQADWENWWCWAYEPLNIPAELDSTQSHTGEKSALIRPQDWIAWGDPWWWGGYWGNIGQNITPTGDSVQIETGDIFYMSVWAMTPIDSQLFGNASVYIELQFKIEETNTRLLQRFSPTSIDEWSEPDTWYKLEAYGFVPDGADKVDMAVTIGQYDEAEGVVFIDDAFFATGSDLKPIEPDTTEIVVPGAIDIANHDFETGDITGWSVWPTSGTNESVTSDSSVSGDYALQLTGPDVAVYQGVSSPQAGRVYAVSGMFMNPSSDPLQEGQQCRLEITFFDASWNHLLQVFSDPITSEFNQDVWHELSVSAFCPEGVVNTNVAFNWLGAGSGTGSAYCDDFMAYWGEAPAEITNLGFEEEEDLWSWDADSGWATWCYEPLNEGVVEDTIHSHGGNVSRKIFTQDWNAWGDPWWWGGYWGGMSQWVMQPVSEGDYYYVSAWVLNPVDEPLTGNVEVYTEMKYKDASDSDLRVYVSEFKVDSTSPPGTWHHVYAIGEAPAGEIAWIECNIYLGQYGEATGVAYVDDFIVAKLGGIETGISDNVAAIPRILELAQNFPNPFNPTTNIKFTLPKTEHVRLTVYDILGKQVATLVDGVQNMGSHVVQFDGTAFASGLYIYRLETDSRMITKKMIFVK
jgi:hypothetical protein